MSFVPAERVTATPPVVCTYPPNSSRYAQEQSNGSEEMQMRAQADP
ncbi:MAG: hypothetical protein ABGZ35_03520 [Planctomycetaceae bacterium]